MKTVLSFGLSLALLLMVSGCEINRPNPRGIQVNLKPESSVSLKAELMPFLASKGFESVSGDAYRKDWPFLILFSPHTKIPALTAYFSSAKGETLFIIGKQNCIPDYSTGEIAIMNECAALLASHGELILSGSVWSGSTSKLAREAFYAKIKKS